MVSKVLYRPFEETDFDSIASVLQPIWHQRSDNDAYNFLEACEDLAHALSVSSFSQVVVIDGAPCGIVLARAARDVGDPGGRWKRAERDLLEQMGTIDPQAAQRREAFSELEGRADDRLLELAALDDAAGEVTLLAVDAEVQQGGIGTVLLDAALAHLSERGSSCAYLFTDTTCTWSFYERRGFTRLARYRPAREERRILPREMYLYARDLSA